MDPQKWTKSDSPALPGTLIFVEHPHVYTLGKSGSENNLLLDNIQLQKQKMHPFTGSTGVEISRIMDPVRLSDIRFLILKFMNIGLKEYIYRTRGSYNKDT